MAGVDKTHTHSHMHARTLIHNKTHAHTAQTCIRTYIPQGGGGRGGSYGRGGGGNYGGERRQEGGRGGGGYDRARGGGGERGGDREMASMGPRYTEGGEQVSVGGWGWGCTL